MSLLDQYNYGSSGNITPTTSSGQSTGGGFNLLNFLGSSLSPIVNNVFGSGNKSQTSSLPASTIQKSFQPAPTKTANTSKVSAPTVSPTNNPSTSFGGGSYSPTSSSLPTSEQPSSLYQQLTNPILNVTPYDPKDYQYPDMQDLMKKAYEALAPYYTKLLQEAQGDVTLALQNLQTDYNTNARYANEDLARTTQQTNENLQGALESLGIQFGGEKRQLLDVLNQRGIATTEDQSQPAGIAVAKQGEGGFEMGLLSEDQQLRQEATQRAAQQTLQNAGVNQQRTTEGAQTTLTRGQQSEAQSLRNYQEQLDTQRRQEALQQAGVSSQQQLGQQQMDIARKQAQALGGGGAMSGDPNKMSQDQKQQLWQQYGHAGQAPIGYGGG